MELPVNTYGQKVYLIYDECDHDFISSNKWFLSHGYPVRNVIVNGKRTKRLLSRDLLSLTDRWHLCDHINGNKLDNRRCNLRVVNVSQNNMNRTCFSSTGYKGVSVVQRKPTHNPKYVARITINRKTIKIGEYFTPEDAAKAYDNMAIKHHGQYARLNNIG